MCSVLHFRDFSLLERIIMKKNVIWMIMMALLLAVRFSDIAPELLAFDSLAKYLPYFIVGYLAVSLILIKYVLAKIKSVRLIMGIV